MKKRNKSTNIRQTKVVGLLLSVLLVIVAMQPIFSVMAGPTSADEQQPNLFRDGCTPIEIAKLTPYDGDDIYYHFGESVAVDGDVVVIGAISYSDSGSVYVYRFNGSSWGLEQKLQASDAHPYQDDFFGGSVAIDSNVIAIGAENKNGYDGAVYIYRFNGTYWVEEQIIPGFGGFESSFGKEIAIYDDVLVVLSQFLEDSYIYRFNGVSWMLEENLNFFRGDSWRSESVDVDGDTVIIGATEIFGGPAPDHGHVYLFNFDGVNWVSEIHIEDIDLGDFYATYLGESVAFEGDTFIASAPGIGTLDPSYINAFKYDEFWNWNVVQMLERWDNPNNLDYAKLAFSGDTLAMGMEYDNDNGEEAGAAYIYQRFDGTCGEYWVSLTKLLASDGMADDHFGYSIAVEGDYIFIGAPEHGSDGAVYIFELQPICFGDLNCDGQVDLADLSELLANYGITSGALYSNGDLDGDGDVDFVDLSELLSHYNQPCNCGR